MLYFSCFMKEFVNVVLEGEFYNKIFIYFVLLLDKEMFFKVGRMIVWSIFYGGVKFFFFELNFVLVFN